MVSPSSQTAGEGRGSNTGNPLEMGQDPYPSPRQKTL